MIHEHLKHGARNAIPVSELCAITGMGERMVREMIERERLDGYLILSGDRGYFFPDKNPLIAELEVNAWLAMRVITANTLQRGTMIAQELFRSGEYKTNE